MGALGIGGLIGLGGDILGGLTKMAGGIANAAGNPKAAEIMNQVGSGIQGVASCASGVCGQMAQSKF